MSEEEFKMLREWDDLETTDSKFRFRVFSFLFLNLAFVYFRKIFESLVSFRSWDSLVYVFDLSDFNWISVDNWVNFRNWHWSNCNLSLKVSEDRQFHSQCRVLPPSRPKHRKICWKFAGSIRPGFPSLIHQMYWNISPNQTHSTTDSATMRSSRCSGRVWMC